MARLRHILVAAGVLGAMELAPHHIAAAAHPATYPGRDGLIAFQADTASGYGLARLVRPATAVPPGLRAALRRALRSKALMDRPDAPSPATTWTQQDELPDPAPAASGDHFGYSVALSGDTALIGAEDKNGATGHYTGAAYVYVRSGTTWTQQAELTDPAPAASFDLFGASVALSGTTALVGAYGKNGFKGAVYVFVRSGTTWTQQAALTDRCPCAANDDFGNSVSLSGSTALIGANGKNSGAGAAYVFGRSGTTWSQQAELTDPCPCAANDYFGYSVALGRGTALIGAPNQNNRAGAAYVFGRSGAIWTQQAELTASDGTANDSFGASVALRGSTALIGASFKNSDAGAAYVFGRSGTTWSQQAELTASDAATNDQFGLSVALGGGTALIGAPYKNNYAGAAYVFVRNGTMGLPEDAPTD